MRKIIIRADDLGYSEGVNLGIEKSIREGIVTSVGLMSNMESAAHGVKLVKDLDFCLGLHSNISAGKPITEPSLIPSLVDDKGFFNSSKVYRATSDDIVNYDEVLLEIEAQYQRFVQLTGQKPCYVDVHAIYSQNFYKAVEAIAIRHGIEHDLFNFKDPHRFRNTLLTVCMESMDPNYDPLASFKRCVLNDYPNDGVGMFVVHPGYLDAYLIKHSTLLNPRVFELEMLTSQETKDWILENNVQLISYREIQ